MKVTVLRAWPNRQETVDLDLAEGSTIADAVAASGWSVADEEPCGVWGKVQRRDARLRERDRVEIYRPLQADPKTARRKRAAR